MTLRRLITQPLDEGQELQFILPPDLPVPGCPRIHDGRGIAPEPFLGRHKGSRPQKNALPDLNSPVRSLSLAAVAGEC